MIYKIFYEFKNASNKTTFDTSSLIIASNPKEALESWALHKTDFVKKNLTNLGVHELQRDYYGRYNKVYTVLNDDETMEIIQEFRKSLI